MVFRRKKKTSVAESSMAPISLETARPAIENLLQACGADATNNQATAAIKNFVRLSGKPTDLMALADAKFRGEHDIVHRPWKWLVQVMDTAAASGDNATAVGGLYWAFHWTRNILPQLLPGDQVDLGLDPIPDDVRQEIRRIGDQACAGLPDDYVIARDSTGELQVGIVRQLAGQL